MGNDNRRSSLRKATQAIHTGQLSPPVYGEVSVPIFQNATFSFPSAEEGAARFAEEHPGFIYTRMENPTVNALQDNVAALENGAYGLATATGMAAISTVFQALLENGAHVVATDALYGSTRVLLENEFARFGVSSTFVDTSNLDNLRKALRPDTRLVFIETPTNPTMRLTDLRTAADVAHQHGALLAVDNTFASPYLQRPLDLGADAVVHSLTKYINGHSDTLGGMIVVADNQLYLTMRRVLRLFGAVMDPHQAWLILRGVRTLPVRLDKAQQNAKQLAEFLRHHRNVTWVRYPGLADHPQHELAGKQMDGFGAMLCFGVRNGLEGGKIVLNNVQLITLAVSLGGVESLIEHPASMTHASVPRQERERAGILDELVRLSVGCEDIEDLKEDLDQALSKIT
ncbi:trans-sulfuration enzyme family protein [Desulfoferrobacter suflitae]|uniref:trans-sulfuration enzyme family protein n=1 Tax=Desulfoferrobacter suflitae TaxID=2865782 RepID=UPI002164AE12|nr:PLP-dependent aspartate aminotransferase family protein [Desulfoferrobacter suflitae]MCK8601680.1 PLP-dependent aspartate aminotransferase family protein [Desulfoferrobacter suflitae]